MRIRVTVDSPGLPASVSDAGPVDLIIEAPQGATFGEARRCLARAAGLGDASDRLTFVTASRAIPPGAPLGVPPLVDGALIHAVSYAGHTPACPPHTERVAGLIELHVVSGPGAGRTIPLGRGTHRVGRARSCDIRLADGGVSRRHAELVVSADGVRFRDLDPTNPSVLQRVRLQGETPLNVGERLRIGSTTMLLRRPDPRAAQAVPADGAIAVNRPPRFLRTQENSTLTFPEPPRRPEAQRLPLVAALAPLVGAAALALALGSPTMLVFGLLSPSC